MFGGGGGKRRPGEADPKDAYVQSFYDGLRPEPEWEDKADRIRAFLDRAVTTGTAAWALDLASPQPLASPPGQGQAQAQGQGQGPAPAMVRPRRPRCAVVTSGSVAVPLDTDGVNCLETMGSGNRGAACAEAFLRAGYHVVFLYREDSLRPFSRVLAKRNRRTGGNWLEQLRLNPATGRIELALDDPGEEAHLREAMARHAALKGRLVEIPFMGIVEYLFLLREACRAVAPFGSHALLFLAAGAFGFYASRGVGCCSLLHRGRGRCTHPSLPPSPDSACSDLCGPFFPPQPT